ncbi:uncharacterized protein LOC106175505 [Lingula anatina]|uniref:Uncharacterized protein LOC106175505 n=1 Tax=Lingula anatina TaxID=7574 RepID=A0A1S3JSJ2_LINAN|nr:uncharacterized protein LOC106175505 [Lingula anatina]|eukprot:XP_013413004.1 uncharacterized protein LOC106175505 [Lingula anatina]
MWKRGIAFALIGLAVFSVTPQPITEVELQANKYAKFGGPVTLRCGFDGTDFTIQYISWTKIYAGAKRRVFVYEFSPLPFYNQSYNDLKGRAFLQYELGSGAMLDSISQPLSHYTSFQPESESAPNDELLPTKTDVEPHFKQNTQSTVDR